MGMVAANLVAAGSAELHRHFPEPEYPTSARRKKEGGSGPPSLVAGLRSVIAGLTPSGQNPVQQIQCA